MSQEVGKTDETEWEDEQIGRKIGWNLMIKSRNGWTKMMNANEEMTK
jgi:hypothetical protein